MAACSAFTFESREHRFPIDNRAELFRDSPGRLRRRRPADVQLRYNGRISQPVTRVTAV